MPRGAEEKFDKRSSAEPVFAFRQETSNLVHLYLKQKLTGHGPMGYDGIK